MLVHTWLPVEVGGVTANVIGSHALLVQYSDVLQLSTLIKTTIHRSHVYNMASYLHILLVYRCWVAGRAITFSNIIKHVIKFILKILSLY